MDIISVTHPAWARCITARYRVHLLELTLTLSVPASKMGTYPPVSHVAHRQRLAALDPGHEGAIKLECASALIR